MAKSHKERKRRQKQKDEAASTSEELEAERLDEVAGGAQQRAEGIPGEDVLNPDLFGSPRPLRGIKGE